MLEFNLLDTTLKDSFSTNSGRNEGFYKSNGNHQTLISPYGVSGFFIHYCHPILPVIHR